jgi:hypothetical protein
VNCCVVVPFTIEAVGGVMDIETSTGAVTDRLAEPVTLPEVAVMFVLPIIDAVANPVELTAATAVTEEFHVAVEVRSCVLSSE